MGMDMKEVLKDNLLGNIRIGTRGNNDRPVKLDYFDVHIDKSTSSMAVELFNEKFNKPKSLIVRFVRDNPMDTYLERYEGRKRMCVGNAKVAISIDENAKKKQIECKYEECEHYKKGKCKLLGRLYFEIKGLEEEGIWCFPVGNQKAIKNNFAKRFARAEKIGEKLTENWYELFLVPEDSIYGRHYVPDIKKIIDVNVNKKAV